MARPSKRNSGASTGMIKASESSCGSKPIARLPSSAYSIRQSARRAGVMRTATVQKVTTLLVVRFRLEITLPGSQATIVQVAEDARFLAFTAIGDDVSWLPSEQVDALLTATPRRPEAAA